MQTILRPNQPRHRLLSGTSKDLSPHHQPPDNPHPEKVSMTTASSPFLTTSEVSELLRTPIPTLYQWRTKKIGPPAIKIGRKILYRREDIEWWLQTQKDPQLHQKNQTGWIPLVGVEIDHETLTELDAVAAKNDTTRSYLIREAINSLLTSPFYREDLKSIRERKVA